jgi:hypothetical protein
MKRYGFIAALSLLASAASAQSPGQIAVMGCQNAVVIKVRAQSPGADDIRFAAAPTVAEKSKKEAIVSGAGQFTEATSGLARRFTYECTYNTRSARTRATVKLDNANGGR